MLQIKIKLMDYGSGFIAAFNGWLLFVEKTIYESNCVSYNERGFSLEVLNANESKIKALRIYGMVLSLILMFTIYKHYQYDHEISVYRSFGKDYTSLWKDPVKRKWLIFELLICCVFMPPSFNGIINGEMNGGYFSYTIDMLISSVILLKSYTLLRLYEHVSMWTNTPGKIMAKALGHFTTFRFALKADIHFNNIVGYFSMFLIIMTYFAALLYNFER